MIRTLIDMTLLDFTNFNNLCKFELSTAIAYFTAKVYNLEKLKTELLEYKNKISPENFSQSFLAAMTLFKKFQIRTEAAVNNTSSSF